MPDSHGVIISKRICDYEPTLQTLVALYFFGLSCPLCCIWTICKRDWFTIEMIICSKIIHLSDSPIGQHSESLILVLNKYCDVTI